MITKAEIHKNVRGKDDSFIIEEDGITRHVPLDPRNRHYQEIMNRAKKEPKFTNFDFEKHVKP